MILAFPFNQERLDIDFRKEEKDRLRERGFIWRSMRIKGERKPLEAYQAAECLFKTSS